MTKVGAPGGATIEQSGQVRFARVEALRAVAALGVVIAHVWGYSHGWNPDLVFGSFWRRAVMGIGLAGVPLFFAASGYLLYLPFARRDFSPDGKPVRLAQYALNRARRILPMYYVSLVIVLLAWRGGGTFEQWWRFLLFAENFSLRTEGTVNGALWSVVVDMQFYLVLPLLALVLARLSGGRPARGAALIVLAILLSWAAWRYGTVALEGGRRRLWHHNLPACFSFIGAGMLLALLRVHVDTARPAWLDRRWAGPDVMLVAAAPIVLLAIWRLELTFLCAISSFLILGAVTLPFKRDGRLVRLLDWRPLATIGIATFSLYIWQGPVIDGLADDTWRPAGFLGLLLVTMPIVLAVAALSYFVIERPFLRRREQWASTGAAPAQTAIDSAATAPALPRLRTRRFARAVEPEPTADDPPAQPASTGVRE